MHVLIQGSSGDAACDDVFRGSVVMVVSSFIHVGWGAGEGRAELRSAATKVRSDRWDDAICEGFSHWGVSCGGGACMCGIM